MKPIAMILLGLVCLGPLSGVAADAQKVNPYTVVLSQVPPAELPARAAVLVKKAKARDWSVTTVNVVKAALEARPASVCAIVNCISKAVPEMAPIAAGTAAELHPEQAEAIAEAAVAAAPSNAAKIALAVSRVVPGSYASNDRSHRGPPEPPHHPTPTPPEPPHHPTPTPPEPPHHPTPAPPKPPHHPFPHPRGPHNYACPE